MFLGAGKQCYKCGWKWLVIFWIEHTLDINSCSKLFIYLMLFTISLSKNSTIWLCNFLRPFLITFMFCPWICVDLVTYNICMCLYDLGVFPREDNSNELGELPTAERRKEKGGFPDDKVCCSVNARMDDYICLPFFIWLISFLIIILKSFLLFFRLSFFWVSLQGSSRVAKKMKLKFSKAWISFLRLPLPLDVYKEVHIFLLLLIFFLFLFNLHAPKKFWKCIFSFLKKETGRW